jgi:hypothetical protein
MRHAAFRATTSCSSDVGNRNGFEVCIKELVFMFLFGNEEKFMMAWRNGIVSATGTEDHRRISHHSITYVGETIAMLQNRLTRYIPGVLGAWTGEVFYVQVYDCVTDNA